MNKPVGLQQRIATALVLLCGLLAILFVLPPLATLVVVVLAVAAGAAVHFGRRRLGLPGWVALGGVLVATLSVPVLLLKRDVKLQLITQKILKKFYVAQIWSSLLQVKVAVPVQVAHQSLQRLHAILVR